MSQNKLVYTFDDKFVQDNFTKNNISTVEDMYLEIGKGILSSKTVVAKINSTETAKFDEEKLQKSIDKNNRKLVTTSETGVVVEGLTNPKIRLGNCCLPIPGDKIIGFITKGNGIVVHNCNCQNLASLEKERRIELEWASEIKRKYPTGIKILGKTRTGLLMDIMNALSSFNIGVSDLNVKNDLNLESVIKIKVLVNNLDELQTLIVNLKKIEGIYNIERVLS